MKSIPKKYDSDRRISGKEYIKLQQHSERRTHHEYEYVWLAGYFKRRCTNFEEEIQDVRFSLR
jgi:hypothetical protein